eukprot:scaffold2580_cov388-Prasinococcus_capsulatus_cf.AAC.6
MGCRRTVQERLEEKYRLCAAEPAPLKPSLKGLVLPSEAKLPVKDFVVHKGNQKQPYVAGLAASTRLVDSAKRRLPTNIAL